MIKNMIFSILFLGGLLACQTHNNGKPVKSAVVRLAPTKGSQVTGYAYFQQKEEGVKVDIRVEGLNPGQKHGYHIHEFGDLREGCSSLCAHYNPFDKQLGGPLDKERHVGDLGNIIANKNGIVNKAYENIKQICIDLQKQTNCPEEDLKDFLEFISRQWNK